MPNETATEQVQPQSLPANKGSKAPTWESFTGKVFKLDKPGVHGEAARYLVEGVAEIDFGFSGGGKKTGFNVTRLNPRGKFTRSCELFVKEFAQVHEGKEEKALLEQEQEAKRVDAQKEEDRKARIAQLV